MQKGIFAISLDHELHWGVSANRTVESYKANLENERAAIAGMLGLFKKYEIHVTWAIVGMLFCKDKNELMHWFSKIDYPEYENKKLSNLELAQHVGFNEKDDPYHFGPDTIRWILSVPHQEIGTHTFSHYYCIEDGQTIRNFESDLQAALEIGKQNRLDQKSIVYPRNQYWQEHLDSSYRKGVSCFRGVQLRKMYHFQSIETRKRRALRLIDCYFRISGDNTHQLEQHRGEKIYNVPSSRFFRPYDPRFAIVEKLRLSRITNEMTYAAKKNRLYHLWWHPHNFGANMQKNLQNLEYILQHFLSVKSRYGFESMNMTEICEYYKVGS